MNDPTPRNGRERSAILISPGPIDGYPPVQHQARLLADAGFSVDVITTPRGPDAKVVFTHPRVRTTALPLRLGRGIPTLARARDFISAATVARRRHAASRVVEIAFDPLGMLYSDASLGRPQMRIAHFHEVLDQFDKSWLQRRLRKSIRHYSKIICADHARAALLKSQLDLAKEPLVVPNYPLALTPPGEPVEKGSDTFEVVYAGSLGQDQKIDTLLASLHDWPPRSKLTLLGDARQNWIQRLLEGVPAAVQNRLNFEGWLDYSKLPLRLAKANLAVSLLDPSVLNWNTSVGASNKRYEYMRAGLPQIGDMNPGVPELLEGNGIGACVKSFDPREITALVHEYASDPRRCAEEGRRAYALHTCRFNYQTAFAPILREIKSALEA